MKKLLFNIENYSAVELHHSILWCIKNIDRPFDSFHQWLSCDVRLTLWYRFVTFLSSEYEPFIELEKCAWHHSVHKTCIKGKCKLIYIRMLHYNLSTTAWGLQFNTKKNYYAKQFISRNAICNFYTICDDWRKPNTFLWKNNIFEKTQC